MATKKLYAGAKLRETRQRVGLTQKNFAAQLGISLPYLNQMENNNRPVSTTVVLALAQEFGFDVTQLASGEAERMTSDMREALADPVFSGIPGLADLRLVAANAPALARAFLELHSAYRRTNERLASLDEALGTGDAQTPQSPWTEVRDFFHYCDNYIDAVDRAAERFGTDGTTVGTAPERAVDALARIGITVVGSDDGPLRRLDRASGHPAPVVPRTARDAHIPDAATTGAADPR